MITQIPLLFQVIEAVSGLLVLVQQGATFSHFFCGSYAELVLDLKTRYPGSVLTTDANTRAFLLKKRGFSLTYFDKNFTCGTQPPAALFRYFFSFFDAA